MELITFLKQIGQQQIRERDKVSVETLETMIIGTIVPNTIIISRDGATLTNILHDRNGELLISVKTTPDGYGPDTGTPVFINDIVSINKEN